MAGRTPIPIANADPAWNPRLQHAVLLRLGDDGVLRGAGANELVQDERSPKPRGSLRRAWSRVLQPARARRLVGPATKSTMRREGVRAGERSRARRAPATATRQPTIGSDRPAATAAGERANAEVRDACEDGVGKRLGQKERRVEHRRVRIDANAAAIATRVGDEQAREEVHGDAPSGT